MTQKRLSKDDWIAAGFRALAKGGHAALRAEAIARDLKTTKGSFYWHFKDISAFRNAMLGFWQAKATAGIINELQSFAPGRARLEALIDAASHTPAFFGGAAVEPAIRDWARHDKAARQVLDTVDQQRLRFVAEELSQMGQTDPTAAHLFYAAHLGLEQLALTTQNSGKAERTRLLQLLADLSP